MNKIWTIAVREYNASVRTKAFLISVLLLPVMMGGSLGVSAFSQKYAADTTTRKIAIIDRTPGEQLVEPLREASEKRNATAVFEPTTHRQTQPKFDLIRVAPSANSPEAIAQQRYDLADQTRAGTIFAFLEIPPAVLTSLPTSAPSVAHDSPAAEPSDTGQVLYSSNTPTFTTFQQWAQTVLGRLVTQRKIETLGIGRDVARSLLTATPIEPASLARKDASGKIVFESPPDLAVALVRPVATIMLMFVIVLVGSSPMSMNVMEEKQQKIAEVMLGSVRPFELMMGKLLGGVGVALTLIAIYFVAAGYAAGKFGYSQYLTADLVIWFVVFSVVAVFLYGSMFLAVGSAVNNAREAQSLITPVMMLVILPILMLTPMLQAPSGRLAMIFSFFPLSAPMIVMARMTIPPGIPVWQPIVSLIGAMLAAVGVIWAAGRIFRVGLLLQGKAPKLKDLARWVIRG